MDFNTNRAAREDADWYFMQKLLFDVLDAGDRFTLYREDKTNSRMDAWIKNNNTGVCTPIELKGRDVNLEDIRDEGVLIDLSKVQALLAYGRCVIVQFFALNNKALIWTIKRSDELDVRDRYCRKNNVDDEKILKKLVYLKCEDAKEYELDMHSYYNIVAFASLLGEQEAII